MLSGNRTGPPGSGQRAGKRHRLEKVEETQLQGDTEDAHLSCHLLTDMAQNEKSPREFRKMNGKEGGGWED